MNAIRTTCAYCGVGCGIRATVTGERSVTIKGDASQWEAVATEKSGSWWTDWAAWLSDFKGGEKAAPKALGDKSHTPIEPAPGRYVTQR